MTDEDAWHRALDELSATIDRQRAHLDLVGGGEVGALAPTPFTADLPPMPPACEERARALLDRLESLSGDVRERSAGIRPRRPARAPRLAALVSRPSTFVRTA